MRSSKIITLVVIGLLIFGSAGFFGYALFVKPYQAPGTHRSLLSFLITKKKTGAVAAVIDPSLAAFESAAALQSAGKLLEAQAAWQTWLETYPNSSKKTEAMNNLGKINMELFCSPVASDQKASYTVVKGDSLDRIARKEKSNAELIQRVNNLPSINLQIGEVLFIPQLNTSLEIDRQAGVLILRNHDQFLKSYSLLSAPAGPPKKPAQTTTIVDRIAMSGNKRTAFGDKKYSESERIILLRSGGGNIVAAPANAPAPAADATGASAPAMPAGFVISTADMKEIFPFITKETSVTIH